MITEIRVQSFKALHDVHTPLGPFVVLVGPNDTGKSSFLEALYALSRSARFPLNHCFWSPWKHLELVHGQERDKAVRFTAKLAEPKPGVASGNGSEFKYRLGLQFRVRQCVVESEDCDGIGASVATGRSGAAQTAVCRYFQAKGAESASEVVQRVAVVLPFGILARLDVKELSAVGSVDAERYGEPCEDTGFGFATALARLKLYRYRTFHEIENTFRSIFPAYEEISFTPASGRRLSRGENGAKQIDVGECNDLILHRTDGLVLRAGNIPGGALMTLALLTLTYLEPSDNLLFLIEEPENGLHPRLLEDVVRCLREVPQRRPGCQVVVTTHSPLLIDHVEPEEVRVFLRNEQGNVTIYNLADVPEIRDRLKYLMLGELVYNDGEEALVKEIPQDAPSGTR